MRRFFLFLLLGAVGVIIFFMYYAGYIDVGSLLAFFEAHRLIAPFLFVAAFALMTPSFIPTLPMNLAAGFLWGPLLGWVFTLLGAATGASLAFFLARFIAHDYFKKRFQENASWRSLQNAMSEHSWKIVLFARMNPIFPFGITSYFFGFTTVSFSSHLLATLLAIAPGALILAFLGNSTKTIVLTPYSAHVMRDVFIFFFALTSLVALRFVLKKQTKKMSD